jgi:hypothetical protein
VFYALQRTALTEVGGCCARFQIMRAGESMNLLARPYLAPTPSKAMPAMPAPPIRTFFTLWKGADPVIHMVKQAKDECAKLQ